MTLYNVVSANLAKSLLIVAERAEALSKECWFNK